MIPILECHDLAFGYNTASPLFSEIDCHFECGEMVSILGPNGAGKTTFLRLISGILQPQRGSIALAGHELSSLSRNAIAQRIAFVPQELIMPFDYTVRQMIEMGRTPHLSPWSWGMLRANDRAIIDHALFIAKLDQMANRQYNALSGGERQRVLIAMALAQEPELLLLDEPTSHLDVRHQIEMLELIATLNKDTGMTVIATLHDLNLAARYFPRLLLFQRGIIADGPPSVTLNPAVLEHVFQVRVHVGIMRGARHLTIVPPGSESIHDEQQPQPQVHIVTGGGTGDLVMRALTELSIPFSAGPVNIGDSDMTLADHLAVNVIAEPPFAPYSNVAIVAATLAMAVAGRVIMCPVPIGPGNIGSIEAAATAIAQGAHVWLFEPTLAEATQSGLVAHVAERDYTSGTGSAIYAHLVQLGAKIITNLPDLTEQVLASLYTKPVDSPDTTVTTGV